MKKYSFLLILLLSLSSCTNSGRDVKNDLNRVQRSMSDVRTFQAEQTSELESIRNELRGLVGRVENLEYLQRAQLGGSPTALTDNVNSLIKKDPPAIVPVATLNEDEAYAATLPNTEVGKTFMSALQLIRDGRFQDALPLLQEAYDRNGSAEGSVHLLFWRGVALEGLGDNRRALETYGAIVAMPTGQTRKALALLRQGSVFIRMGDSRTADLTFRKLINDYPQSVEAEQAKQRLADLR